MKLYRLLFLSSLAFAPLTHAADDAAAGAVSKVPAVDLVGPASVAPVGPDLSASAPGGPPNSVVYPARIGTTSVGAVVAVRGLAGATRATIAGNAAAQVASAFGRSFGGMVGLGFLADTSTQVAMGQTAKRPCEVDVKLDDGHLVTAQEFCAHIQDWKMYPGAQATVQFEQDLTVLLKP